MPDNPEDPSKFNEKKDTDVNLSPVTLKSQQEAMRIFYENILKQSQPNEAEDEEEKSKNEAKLPEPKLDAKKNLGEVEDHNIDVNMVSNSADKTKSILKKNPNEPTKVKRSINFKETNEGRYIDDVDEMARKNIGKKGKDGKEIKVDSPEVLEVLPMDKAKEKDEEAREKKIDLSLAKEEKITHNRKVYISAAKQPKEKVDRMFDRIKFELREEINRLEKIETNRADKEPGHEKGTRLINAIKVLLGEIEAIEKNKDVLPTIKIKKLKELLQNHVLEERKKKKGNPDIPYLHIHNQDIDILCEEILKELRQEQKNKSEKAYQVYQAAHAAKKNEAKEPPKPSSEEPVVQLKEKEPPKPSSDEKPVVQLKEKEQPKKNYTEMSEEKKKTEETKLDTKKKEVNEKPQPTTYNTKSNFSLIKDQVLSPQEKVKRMLQQIEANLSTQINSLGIGTKERDAIDNILREIKNLEISDLTFKNTALYKIKIRQLNHIIQKADIPYLNKNKEAINDLCEKILVEAQKAADEEKKNQKQETNLDAKKNEAKKQTKPSTDEKPVVQPEEKSKEYSNTFIKYQVRSPKEKVNSMFEEIKLDLTKKKDLLSEEDREKKAIGHLLHQIETLESRDDIGALEKMRQLNAILQDEKVKNIPYVKKNHEAINFRYEGIKKEIIQQGKNFERNNASISIPKDKQFNQRTLDNMISYGKDKQNFHKQSLDYLFKEDGKYKYHQKEHENYGRSVEILEEIKKQISTFSIKEGEKAEYLLSYIHQALKDDKENIKPLPNDTKELLNEFSKEIIKKVYPEKGFLEQRRFHQNLEAAPNRPVEGEHVKVAFNIGRGGLSH